LKRIKLIIMGFRRIEMCEINVIMIRGETRERVMDSVAKILVEGNSILLTGILGDRMTVEGSIKEVNFSRGEALILAK
jgi:predicted RNA-binding protein